jgi:hypothetical protein
MTSHRHHTASTKNDNYVERHLCKACVAYDAGEKSYILVFDQCFVDKDLTSPESLEGRMRWSSI